MKTRTLRRANRDRWLLGVCGGIAHSNGWNPAAVRLGTVVLAIIVPGPSLLPTVAVYLLLGIFLPRSDEY